MSTSTMIPQEFRNLAGVGYIQGMLQKYLDKFKYPHQVVIDGMYGINTVHGLNTMSFKAFNRIAKESHLFQAGTFNDQWENGIMSFQRWYGDLYEQMGEEETKRMRLPVPQNDGDWGPETKKCFDRVLEIFKRCHSPHVPEMLPRSSSAMA